MAKPIILIVDDESNTSILVQNMLEELGYNVAGPVSSGKEAIQKALQTQPDLVLMDIILDDEMDGVEAARQIYESLDIPVVYLTGHADDRLLQRAKLTEPYGYIIKPFDEKDLRTNIEIALYRHKMEKLLKESEKRYKAICELTSDYIFHINVSKDKQMLFDWITDGFVQLTGYTRKEVENIELWKKIILPDDIFVVNKALQNIMQGSKEEYEHRIITKGGETLWLIVNMRPEWDTKKQNVIGIIGAASNITKCKLIEDALVEAKHKAEATNLAKSEFLANMSHELKTPLNSVIGFSEILLDKSFGEINEKQEKYLNHIRKSGKHLLELINDIIDLSRAEAGRMELELKEFSLPRLLNDMLTVVKLSAFKNNIGITIDVDEKLSTIQADEAKLKKTVNILLDNAIKYTPDGGKTKVEVTRINDKFKISVTDTGIGIKPEDKERIFKGFEQVDGSYRKKYGGTGTGLALAKKFVEMHGGKIWVESPPKKDMALEEGKGSSFIFTIPCKLEQLVEQIVDPSTKLLTREYFLKHIERILLLHKRMNHQFSLLRLELESGEKKLDPLSFAEVLKDVIRKYEIFTHDKDKKCYYTVLLDTDRQKVNNAAKRISEALKERKYTSNIKTVTYPEDGDSVDALLKALRPYPPS